MSKYSTEFKEKMVEKMMPPNAISAPKLSQESGIPYQTLYTWKVKYQNEGKAVPANSKNPENWSGKDKLAVIIETASLNQQALSEYCRKKGLYVEQITRWKISATQGIGSSEHLSKKEREVWQQDKKEKQQLKKELLRKDKALAETAALLVLEKKAQIIWGEKEK